MSKWNLLVGLLLSLVFSSLVLAQDAYDDEAFEESVDVRLQRQDAEFFEAVELMNDRGMGTSVKEFKRLAVEGHARSQHLLGMFFRYGTGVRKNAKRSVQWLKLGSEQRYPAAMLAYAEAALAGEGMRRDEKLARELLEPLVEKHWSFPVPMEDFALVRSMRSQASFLLGGLLAEGKGGDEDFERSIGLMKEASNTGSVYATMYLAVEYAKGEKVERDLVETRRYFDLVDLQVFDSVRREVEVVLMGIKDPVVEEEIREEVVEMGKLLTKELVVSQRELGEAFLDEDSEDFDPTLAAGLLKLAADGGDSIAPSVLGQLYWKGLGVAKDLDLAMDWFGRAADKQSSVGRYNFGVLALSGSPTKEEREQAELYLYDAADVGHFAAQLVLDGVEGLSVLSDDEDVALAKEWEARGDARADYALAKRAERGWVLEREEKEMKVFKRYLSIAKAGYHRAQKEVADAYYYGTGPKKDFKKAFPWFVDSAEQGNRDACFRVGYMYSEGEGVDVNESQAIAYYERAMALGSMFSANNLANYYFEGKEVEKDEERAIELYLAAAENGSDVACYNIGLKYLKGEGVELNDSLGIEWLSKSGEKGNKAAIEELIRYYSPGEETVDVVELIYWTEKLAEKGDKAAMKQVAIFYQKGIGVPKSNLKAVYWISTYLNRGRSYEVKIRNDLLGSERVEAVRDFLPLDYEAILVYVELLMDEKWTGFDLEAAFEVAKLFKKTDLFAGRLLLAKLNFKEGIKDARSYVGVRLYEDIYKEGVLETRFYKHAVKAAYFMSKLYGSGEYVDQDDVLCAEWMKKAADLGFNRAQYFYADFLWNGMGVEQNRTVAKMYLNHLSKNGYDKATVRLGELVVAGDVEEIDQIQLMVRLSRMAVEGSARAKSILKELGVETESEPRDEDGEETPNRDEDWVPTVLG